MSTEPRIIEAPNLPTMPSHAPAGWPDLIDEAIEVLDRHHPGWTLKQITETRGGLRISYDPRSNDRHHREQVLQRIWKIEDRSYLHCDICGAPARVVPENYTRQTRCPTHEHAVYIGLEIVERSVHELTAQMSGIWLIKTRGSIHVWDLDNMTYIRRPGIHSRAGGMEFDGMAMPISRVEAWPRVGASFFVWFDDPSTPELVEHYRISSVVQDIRRHTDAGSHHDE